jgi:ABC-type lipoprotein release transport system permease subunit
MDFLPDWLNTFTLVLMGAVAVVLLFVLFISLRNPIIGKMGVRNIPRRPAQTVLIVSGLTLSTVIIISALSIGDTLDYSVQRHAVDAYGEIDQIIAPPLITLLASLGGSDEEVTTEELNAAAAEAGLDLSGTGFDTLLSLLTEGLPGISNERFAEFRADTENEPLIDGVAPAIVFPTIIRNVNTGQGEPFGFIFAVDSYYDQEFGLHNVRGEPVTMDALQPGVGNIFQSATNLFVMAGQSAHSLGVDLNLSDAAVAVAAAGALASGSLDEAQANQLLAMLLGESAPQLPPGSFEQLQGLLPQQPGGTDANGEGAEPSTGPAAEPSTEPSAETATESTTEPATGEPVPALAALNVPDATELLSALNLNTLRAEVDRVLGQFGLQLRQGDVYLNRLGADRLGADVGDVLEIYLGPIPVPYRVKGIVNEAGPMGALMPVVMMRLDEAQQLLSPVMPDRVNAILVSNLGDPLEGIKHTAAVSDRLRYHSLDLGGAEKVAAILRRPQVLAEIEREAANVEHFMPSAGEAFILSFFGDIVNMALPNAGRIQALPVALGNPGFSDELRLSLADTTVRAWLLTLRLDGETSAELSQAMKEMTAMEVLDPLNKQTIVAISGVAGTVFSTIFSIFGIFSIMAGVLLIFMIFVMLAAERRSEMGMARAVGMQRSHLVQMFVTEGVLYDLAAALVGVVLGLGVSYLMIDFMGSIFSQVGSQYSGQELFFRFHFNVTPASVIIAYCLGVLFTFGVVIIASSHASRLNIVAAIRDLPDAENAARRSLFQKIVRAVVGPLLAAGGAYIIWLGMEQGLTAILTGVTLVLVGAAFLAEWLLADSSLRSETRKRIIYSVVGLGLIVIWGISWSALLGERVSLFAGNPAWVPLTFALGGPMLILGGILVVMFNADTWVWGINRLLGGVGALTPVLRIAIAYPLSNRFRTGMAMTMFAMVITTVVIMSIVINATQTLVEPDAERSAGFEIELQTTLLSFFDPIDDLAARIAQAADFPAEDVTAVGRFGSTRVEVRQVGEDAQLWSRRSVAGLDAGYIQQASTVYPLKMRAPGYADDAAVWEALAERDDVAIITPGLLESASASQPVANGEQASATDPEVEMPVVVNGGESQAAAMERGRHGRWAPLRLTGIDPRGRVVPDGVMLEFRHPESGEMATVQVIGVLEAYSTLTGQELQVGQATYERITGAPLASESWYVKVREGADVRSVAAALERTFLSSGLDATILAESFAQGQEVLRGILQLFQGFMALGLFVGIAALGVISSRTVVERRQQVGMLRAIGYQPGMVALSFVLESSFIAFVGIGIGTATGVLLGQNMLGEFFSEIDTGVSFTLPWLEITGILVVAYLFSLLTTILPAYQASRIYPAEALRYE